MPDYIVNTSNTVTTTTTSTNHLSAVVSGRANLDVVVPNAPTLAVTIGPNPLVPVMYVAGPQGPHGPPGPPGSGITSINGLSGIVNIYGTGNIAVSTSGQSIYVSGINLANSGDISTLSNRIEQTGSYLYNLLTGVSGGFTGGAGDVTQAELNATGAKITDLSGYVNSQLYQTGSSLYNLATGISGYLQGQIDSAANGVISVNGLSGVLNVTGAGNVSVFNIGQNIVISGNTGDYALFATKTQLTQSGVDLVNYISGASGSLANSISNSASGYITTGQTGQFYPASNPQAYATSGDLAQTGSLLFNRDSAISGGLEARIAQTGQSAFLATSGASGILQVQIDALPTSASLQSTGQQLYAIITGLSGQASTDYATKSQLTQTGVSLGAEIDALSGFVGLASGSLNGTITATGTSAVTHANGIGINLSGNLAQTGSYLYNQTTGLSGYVIDLISAASAGVAAINGASGVLSIVGTGAISVITEGQMIWISGDLDAGAFATTAYVTGVSGVLSSQIASLPVGVTMVNSVSGAINLVGRGNVAVTVDGQNINISGVTPDLPFIFNRYNLPSGNSSTGFIPFYYSFSVAPQVVGSLVNNSGDNLIPHYVSGINQSGFYLSFSNDLSTNNYQYHYYATTGTGYLAMGGGGMASSSNDNVTTVTNNYNIGETDDIVIFNKTTAITGILPAINGLNKSYILKNINVGELFVSGIYAQTIDGQTSQALTQWDSMSVVNYASGAWIIV